ncbi:MAG: NAD-dependent deacylase [Candidatus Bathyarchaeia archaeon]
MEAYSTIMAIAHELKHVKRTVALTGAGISAESGLGTFRGRDGLWSRYDPAVVASIESFNQNPRKFWEFARDIGWKFLDAEPNAAHIALAELAAMKHLNCVITQNIDGLHQRAGSKDVIEIHGNIERVDCTMCATTYATERIIDSLIQQDVPTCQRCGGTLKPDVVLFGEEIPKKTLAEAVKKVGSADVLLTVGSSLEVYPASSFPELAKKSQAKLISINMERTRWDDFSDYAVHGSAAEVLPRIVQAIRIIF